MKLIRGIHNLQPLPYGCVLTIGNFDGVHRGHLAILSQLISTAHRLHIPSMVMLFEPQPQEYFATAQAPARLTALREKCYYLAQMGVDQLLCITFKEQFALYDAGYFIHQLLIKQLGVQSLIIGDDFQFGAGRCGDFSTLKTASKQYGFSITSIPALTVDGQRISSTVIRRALQADKLLQAEELLGHPYKLCGRVAQGKQLGRRLGFPTANILLKRRVAALHGVYAVTVQGITAQPLLGVANIGTRPTVGGTRQQLEVHLLDSNQPLYGQHLQVLFHCKLRQEQCFTSLTELSQQISCDIQAARCFFASSPQVYRVPS